MKNNKRAFTLLELIVAIVIIGIVFATVPTLMQSNSKSLDSSLKQEAIFMVSSKMEQVLSYRWDENSLPDDSSTAYANVVEVVGESSRAGFVNEDLHRRYSSDSLSASTIGSDGGDSAFDDMDDFDNSSSTLNNLSAQGYKTGYNIEVDVSYVDNIFDVTPSVAASTNIKLIEVSAVENNIPVVILRSYSSNIGEVDFYKRRMQ